MKKSTEGFLFFAFCFCIFICIAAVYKSESDWEKFANANHCIKISEVRGAPHINYSVNENGSVIQTHEKTTIKKIYNCNGEKYVR